MNALLHAGVIEDHSHVPSEGISSREIQKPRILEIGSSDSSLTKYLEKLGYSVLGLEPNKEDHLQDLERCKMADGKTLRQDRREILEKALPMTVEEFSSSSEEKFPLIISANTHANDGNIGTFIASASSCNTKDGAAYLGFSTIDPQYVDPQCSYNYKQPFEYHYEEVNIIHASQLPNFEERYSDGGNIAFLECKRPILRNEEDNECSPM